MDAHLIHDVMSTVQFISYIQNTKKKDKTRRKKSVKTGDDDEKLKRTLSKGKQTK